MSSTARAPRRPIQKKGVPLGVHVDPDASRLLRTMCPNGKGLGLFLSELIRKEARERAERPALLQTLAGLAAQDGA